MKKSIYHSLLTGICLMTLAWSFSACTDDDDEPSAAEQSKEQAVVDERDAAWQVLSQLVDPKTAGDDWTQQTFEPAIGTADESNPLRRIEMTNTLANAAQRFANIVGLETLDSTTTTYTYSNPQLGTLTYQRSDDGRSLATVTVNIKQLPGLQQIVYRNPEQSGENGWLSKFNGRAYYRFGDVVCKVNSVMDREYWVCVRPSLGYEGKGDSHWITLSRLSPETQKEKTVKGRTFVMPKGLGEDKENVENLGEMLTSLLNQDAWYNYFRDAEEADYAFHDLDWSNYFAYNNEYFWTIVREAWDKLEVPSYILGPGYSNCRDLKTLIQQHGLRLIYGDPSWSWFGYKCTFKQATMSQYNQLLKPTYDKVTKDMAQCQAFDAYRFEEADQRAFFGDEHPRWFIRHATGKELAGGKYDAQKPLSAYSQSVSDVYVYYRYIAERGTEPFDLKASPEETTMTDAYFPNGFTNGKRGYFAYGDVVKDDKNNRWICIQPAFPQENYNSAYFISFDKATKSNGVADFTQLPTLEQAMQIAFNIWNGTQNCAFVPQSNSPLYSSYLSMKDADFDFNKYLALREIITNNEFKDSRAINIMYKDAQTGKPCIFRYYKLVDNKKSIFTDDTAIQHHLYTCYVKDLLTNPRKMTLADLSNQQIVDQYANESFVNWPWVVYDIDNTHKQAVEEHRQSQSAGGSDDVFKDQNEANDKVYDMHQTVYRWYTIPSQGIRQTTEPTNNKQWKVDLDFDISDGKGLNMYNEPVLVFAVKRAVDNGKKPFKFADGQTPIYTWRGNSSSNPVNGLAYNADSSMGAVYHEYDLQKKRMYLNGVKLDVNNIPFTMNPIY